VPRVLSCVGVVALGLLLSACVATDTTVRSTATSSPLAAASTPQSSLKPTPQPTAEPTPATSTYAVGDVITISKGGAPWADFTVLEVKEAAQFVDPNGYYNDTPQTDGYVYMAANVRYEALTDGVMYGSYDFQVFVAGQAVAGYAFAVDGPEPALSAGTLPMGRIAEGWLLYEVPPTGQVLLSYSGNVFLSEAPIFEVVLRNT
jgi:hypothetical protein